MPFRIDVREHASLALFLLKWLCLATPLGIAAGSACAFFLWSLDAATAVRLQQPWLLYLLPLAGAVVGLTYVRYGKSVEGGNNLIVDEIHEPGGGIPLRMAPLILFSTVVTHLFGGSAGREGTAVQMGGSLASFWASLFPRSSRSDVRILLMAGVSAGFGGVFGTPVAGTIFAMEVLAIGRMNYAAIVPCLIAGAVADRTCTAWGVAHTHYHLASQLAAGSPLHLAPLAFPLAAKIVLAGAIFGLASVFFSELVHGLHHLFKRVVAWPVARPAVGGLLVVGLVWLSGSRDYLGLGVSSPDPEAVTIVRCFQPGGADAWSWLWKTIFTAVTLGSGFKGGEVTPLFFIGAALGNALAAVFGAPVDLFAALGFVAVFAGATNTPLACTMMGVELFGGEFTVHFATACFIAYLFSGHSGIYLSQRIGTPKSNDPDAPAAETLRSARESRPSLAVGIMGAASTRLTQGDPPAMSKPHRVVSKEIGQLRVYLPQGETRRGTGLWAVFGKPLFRELVDLAKADGVMNATTISTPYGYTNRGKVHGDSAESANPHVSVCVELTDHRERLEAFCRKHSDVLKGRVIVYKHLEHWELHEHEIEVAQERGDPAAPPD